MDFREGAYPMTTRRRLRSYTPVPACVIGLLVGPLCVPLHAAPSADTVFFAARCAGTSAAAWGILNRDGAGRETEPYLSSLVGGESQTGRIGSPPFKLSTDTVRFTIRGHDGPGGGRDQNYLALLDNKTGTILRKTLAPGNDALQSAEWDVTELRGRTVRLVVVDGNAETAFAWLGIGRIDAGPEMSVDFRRGLPDDWKTTAEEVSEERRPVRVLSDGPIPFQVSEDCYTWIPEQGASQIAIGTRVKALYILGATVPANRVLATYGYLDVIYADDTRHTVPLVYGLTLEGTYKQASGADTLHLLPVGDGTQYLLAIRPDEQTIQRIELRRAAADLPRPRVSAITCELPQSLTSTRTANDSAADALTPLPALTADPQDLQWLAAHTLPADGSRWPNADDRVRRARGEPLTLEDVQRIEGRPPVRFSRRKISDEAFEAASVCDVDRDGHQDIVSGNFWYAGPDFQDRHAFRSLQLTGGYHDSFSDYPLDVDGDGDMDIVSGGWFGKTLLWCENPGRYEEPGDWTVHEIDQPGSIETTRCWDVDGDGFVEVVPNAGGNVVFYRLERDPQGKGLGRFRKHIVQSGGCGHGLGFGDVNGDGRGDFVTPSGWLAAPPDPLTGEWVYHKEFQLDRASVPILVHDVDGDGLNDLIYGDAHGYGLFWVQQGAGDQGQRTWTRHTIEDRGSQYHDLQLADLTGDGRAELVTGKRYHAHNGHDPGAGDPVFVRYFVLGPGGVFSSVTIDFGSPADASGVGIYFWIEDVDRDRRPDIVAPGKEGLYLFLNQGP
jgi:hypothetical protein